MTRLSSAFYKPHPALVTFITAGDGDTAANLDALVEGGADVIELGMPFTDPMARRPRDPEGEYPQPCRWHHNRRHLRYRRRLPRAAPQHAARADGLCQPDDHQGCRLVRVRMQQSGVDGVICVDIPPEEDPELGPLLRSAGIDLIRLATPTTDTARLPVVLDGASGFLIMSASPGSPACNRPRRPASTKPSPA